MDCCVYTFFSQQILTLLVATTTGLPQGYNLPEGDGFSISAEVPFGEDSHETGGLASDCKEGEILHVDGTCTTPIITRNVFLYDAPEIPAVPISQPSSVPPPKVDRNVFLVSLPEDAPPPEPIVVPPPKQTSIVYVLNKKEEDIQKLIEVPTPPASNPEVYFVNYEEGENPTLPLGIDLETALSSAADAGGGVLGTDGGLGIATAGLGDGFGGDEGFGSNGGLGGVGFGVNGFGDNGGLGNAGGVGDGVIVAGVSGGFDGGNGGLGSQAPSGLYASP